VWHNLRRRRRSSAVYLLAVRLMPLFYAGRPCSRHFNRSLHGRRSKCRHGSRTALSTRHVRSARHGLEAGRRPAADAPVRRQLSGAAGLDASEGPEQALASRARPSTARRPDDPRRRGYIESQPHPHWPSQTRETVCLARADASAENCLGMSGAQAPPFSSLPCGDRSMPWLDARRAGRQSVSYRLDASNLSR
jgi:hypothetical protein